MPCLAVLDLSRTGIRCLPKEIKFLVELRYLNLESTFLESLPKELGRLRSLRILNLDKLSWLKEIPKEAISLLEHLQSLTMNVGSYKWKGGWKDNVGEYEVRDIYLKDLDGLKKLEEFWGNIVVEFHEDLSGLSNCPRLCSAIKFLEMKNLESFASSDLSKVLEASKDLRKLFIITCHTTSFTLDLPNQTKFRNLQDLKIFQCNAMEIIRIAKLPHLQFLCLEECTKMVEIIGVEELETTNVDPIKDSIFPSLRHIFLKNMQNLERVYTQPLLVPSLKEIIVNNCPKLEKLPFELSSAPCLEVLQLVQCNKMAEII